MRFKVKRSGPDGLVSEVYESFEIMPLVVMTLKSAGYVLRHPPGDTTDTDQLCVLFDHRDGLHSAVISGA